MNDYLTTVEAAERLGVSLVGLRRMIKREDLPTTRFGRMHMIAVADLDAMPRRKTGRPLLADDEAKPASLKQRAYRAR